MKLPDIGFQRPVQEIKSPKAAGLGTKLRNIDAAVGTTDKLVGKVNKLIDTEVKLDATRRLNEAERSYQKSTFEIAQKYHDNRELDAGGFAGELANARSNAFQSVQTDASGRVNKLLAGAQDNFNTRVQATELDAVEKLLTSRSLMHLTDIGRDTLDSLNPLTSPQDFEDSVALNTMAWEGSGLNAEQIQEGKGKFAAAATAYQIELWASAGDIQSMTDISETDAFKQLGPEGRLQLQNKIDVAQSTILENTYSGVIGEVADNLMMLDVGVTTVTDKIAETNMSQSEKDKATQSSSEDVFSSKMDGLLATQQWTAATALLDDQSYGLNGSNIKPGEKVPGWRKSIASGQRTTSSATTVVMMSRMKDNNARLLTGGQNNTALIQQVTERMNSGEFTQSQFESAQLEIERTNTFTQVTDTIGAIPTADTDQLYNALLNTREQLQALESGGGDSAGFRDKKTALEEVSTTLQQHMDQRTSKPVDYALQWNPSVNAAYDTWTGLTRQFMTDPQSTSLGAVQQAYAEYSTLVNTAQDNYGTAQRGRSTLPTESAALQGIVSTMLEGNFMEQQASMNMLVGLMGQSGVSDLVETIMDDAPSQAMMLALRALPNNSGTIHAEILARGIQVAEQQKGSIPTNEDFRKSLNSNSIDMPSVALGDLNRVVSASVYTYALGFASPEELSSGQFEKNTLEQARDAVIGKPFRISPNASPSIPFRDNTGAMVPSDQLENTFKRARLEGSYGDEAFGKVYDATGKQLNWKDALEWTTPIMVENGVYQLSVTHAGGFRQVGALMGKDENGNLVRKLVDLNAVNVGVNATFYSLEEVDLGAVN